MWYMLTYVASKPYRINSLICSATRMFAYWKFGGTHPQERLSAPGNCLTWGQTFPQGNLLSMIAQYVLSSHFSLGHPCKTIVASDSHVGMAEVSVETTSFLTTFFCNVSLSSLLYQCGFLEDDSINSVLKSQPHSLHPWSTQPTILDPFPLSKAICL